MKDNTNIRLMVRGVYDLQQLRIQQGNRIVANFKAKLGQAPGMAEEDLDPATRSLLSKLRMQDSLMTDGIVDELEGTSAEEKAAKKKAGIVSKLIDKHYDMLVPDGSLMKPKKFIGDAIISSYTELCLIQQYKEIVLQEENQFARLKIALNDFPIYTQWLTNVKGIGPAMAGVLISELDVSRAEYASSFAMYAGLDVASDGRGRSKQAAHLVDWSYIDKDGKPAIRKGITFNPFLKTKLMGVLSGSFLRSASPYAKLYYDYKNRLENHPDHIGKTKLHRHRMALRRMVKIFLQDFWAEWRKIENLPVSAPYHVAKLGLDDHGLEKGLIERHGTGYAVQA